MLRLGLGSIGGLNRRGRSVVPLGITVLCTLARLSGILLIRSGLFILPGDFQLSVRGRFLLPNRSRTLPGAGFLLISGGSLGFRGTLRLTRHRQRHGRNHRSRRPLGHRCREGRSRLRSHALLAFDVALLPLLLQNLQPVILFLTALHRGGLPVIMQVDNTCLAGSCRIAGTHVLSLESVALRRIRICLGKGSLPLITLLFRINRPPFILFLSFLAENLQIPHSMFLLRQRLPRKHLLLRHLQQQPNNQSMQQQRQQDTKQHRSHMRSARILWHTSPHAWYCNLIRRQVQARIETTAPELTKIPYRLTLVNSPRTTGPLPSRRFPSETAAPFLEFVLNFFINTAQEILQAVDMPGVHLCLTCETT